MILVFIDYRSVYGMDGITKEQYHEILVITFSKSITNKCIFSIYCIHSKNIITDVGDSNTPICGTASYRCLIHHSNNGNILLQYYWCTFDNDVAE